MIEIFFIPYILIAGHMHLIILSIVIICALSYILKGRNRSWIHISVLTVVHLFLLYNTSDWNEGAMAGSTYIIPFLKPATDELHGLFLLSIFSAFIPLIMYIFILSGIYLICKKVITQNF